MQQKTRSIILFILSVAGFLIAVSTGLLERLPALQAFCFGTSNACSDSARFHLFSLPVWLWGGCFYALLTLAVFRFGQFLPWLAAAALGVEAALVSIMVTSGMFCPFCLANLVVVLAMVAFAFDRSKFWQMLSVTLMLLLFAVFWIPYENRSLFASPAPVESDVLARVGDESILSGEVEIPLATPIYDYEKTIYRLKLDRLEQIVMDKVITKEAAERNVTVENLVNKNILAGGIKVGDDEIDRYIEQNLERYRGWPGGREDLRAKVKSQLEQQKRFDTVANFCRSLWPKYGVVINLKEPQMRLAKISLEESQSLGPPDAPVVIVQFSDYQCPVCREMHTTVHKIREAYAGKVRWVFKDFPLVKHTFAHEAAEAARCAAEQNKFWEYQDAIYAVREELNRDQLIKVARDLGLDAERFKQCLESGKYKAAVDKDIEEGKKTGVSSIPALVINGKIVVGGYSFEHFKGIIDAELMKAEKKS